MRYDVFISYSSKDKDVVQSICRHLEECDVRCFVAFRDIPKGKVWAEEIISALDNSSMMLVVFSDNFNRSRQVDREIEIASEDGKPILTCRIADVEFQGAKKYYLKNINWIDAFPDIEQGFDELRDNVGRLLGRELVQPVVANDAPPVEPEHDGEHSEPEQPVHKIEPQEYFPKQTPVETSETVSSAKERLRPVDSRGSKKSILMVVSLILLALLAIILIPNMVTKEGGDEQDLSVTDNGAGRLTAEELHAVPISVDQIVDLGLSVSWAGYNLGATYPEGCGHYYAWGETTHKNTYNWETYSHGDEDECKDVGDISATDYDAATAEWGSGWRLPDKHEVEELLQKCQWQWSTYNGMHGYKVVGPNGNAIFLPASGLRQGSVVFHVGMHGYYWIGTADKVVTKAFRIGFDDTVQNVAEELKAVGFAIRPVYVE